MGKLFIPRKEFLLSPEELDRALRTDFLTIERWAKDSSTRIILPDGGDPLSGDVSVIPGNNVGILRDGNGFLIYANPPGLRRGLSVFAPGAAAARTLMKATIPDPVLQAIDVFILTAATGADASNHSNVIVEGTTSGSVTLPITSGLQEWHLGPGDIGVPLGSERLTSTGAGGNNAQTSSPAICAGFSPSADLTVFNLDATWWLATPSGTSEGANPAKVRFGIAKGVAAGQTPTLDDPTGGGGVGWVTGVDGLSKCYVDLDANGVSAGVRQQFTLPGSLGFKLLQGQTYHACFLHKNTTPATNSNVRNSYDAPNSGGSYAVQGNITRVGLDMVLSGGTQGAFPHGSWTNFGGVLGNVTDFSLLGSIVGVMLTGLVQVRQTITGAPTTPGSDMNIYVQC